MDNFTDFLEDVRSQLECNASKEFIENNVSYTYSNESIHENIDYFKDCFQRGLSGYKALLYFGFYLSEKNEENIL